MMQAYADYVNSFPAWYAALTPFVGLICGYVMFWGFTDGGRFASGYYRVKMFKGLIGVLFCLAILWAIPVLIFFIRLPFRFHKSEIDEVEDYERKAYKRRGLDYDEEMSRIERERWEKKDEERHRQWLIEVEEDRLQEEIENNQRQAEMDAARFGERYFGGM